MCKILRRREFGTNRTRTVVLSIDFQTSFLIPFQGQDTRSLYWKQQQAWQSPVPPVQLRPSGSNTPPIPNRHQSATAQLYNTKQNGFAGAPVSNRANVHLLSNGGRNSVPSSDYGPVTRPVAVLDIPAANTVDLESSPYQNFGNNAIEIQSSPSPSPEPVAADTQQRKLTIVLCLTLHRRTAFVPTLVAFFRTDSCFSSYFVQIPMVN